MVRLFVLALVGASACKRAPEAKPLTLDDGKGKTHECKLVAGGRIQQDTAIEAACQVTIAEPYTVTKGATLRIGSGSRLAFKKGAYLLVQDGALIVEGTKEAPVVMTSAEAKPAAGDWEASCSRPTSRRRSPGRSSSTRAATQARPSSPMAATRA